MRTSTRLALAALLSLLAIGPVLAQGSGHEQHHPPDQTPPPTAPNDVAPGMMGPEMMRGRMMGPDGMCDMMMGQDRGMGMMRGHRGDMAGPVDPVDGAFAAINRRMHRDMSVQADGDPDRAFAEAMVAHHLGAIDMAKVTLAFGRDPEIKALAEQVIKAQEEEVGTLRRWLAAHPRP